MTKYSNIADAEQLAEAVKEPHNATKIRDGIYPLTGIALALLVMIGLVVYFA